MATSTRITINRQNGSKSSSGIQRHESFKLTTTTSPTSSSTISNNNEHHEKQNEQEDGILQDQLNKDQEYHDSFLAKVERNQIPLSRNLMILLYSLNFISRNQSIINFTNKFIHLQNKVGINEQGIDIYDISIDDTYYVINWVITVTFLRSFLMKYCFEPFASKFCHIYSRKAKTRFAEQSWSFVYYSLSFIYGVYLYLDTPYFNNLDQIYINWPNFLMDGKFKSYYLVSMAFWLQQIFVLNIEKPRKDHYQMFSHHIITCLLIIGSYYYYYFRIGHLILMIMDSVDIFLAAAKMLKYAGLKNACDGMFVLFLISWIVLRHGVYNYIFYHAWHKSVHLMKDGQCVNGTIQKRCWTPTIINTFLGLLGGLQIITCIWMYLILKVAYKVIIGVGAEDVRSDEDDTDVEENEEEEVVVEKKEKIIDDNTSIG
ncbi:lag1 [Candida pseudojiufengensis]|uniref:lag1 n=1 Tax=Candida pseudojiufengensis TaxID=497109 RepID=UPI0022242517|nr:lag1 [Candida pseudojiufengensis]KAI5961642.1 lag1 [Candida pseudojiufengensis]